MSQEIGFLFVFRVPFTNRAREVYLLCVKALRQIVNGLCREKSNGERTQGKTSPRPPTREKKISKQQGALLETNEKVQRRTYISSFNVVSLFEKQLLKVESFLMILLNSRCHILAARSLCVVPFL